MRLDDILETIGGFGPYQKWVFALTCGPNLLAGFFMLNPVFLLGIPNHRCAISGYTNDTYDIQDDFHNCLINLTIPRTSSDEESEYDRCNIYTVHNPVERCLLADSAYIQIDKNETDTTKCETWVYDRNVFDETFVSKHDLVCNKEIYVANAGMLLYAGMLVGSLLSGILSDMYGRKPVFYVSIIFMVGSSIWLAFTTTYATFLVAQFIMGAAVVGAFMPAYVISLEITSSNKRVWPGVISDFPYVFGLIMYAVIAYFLRDWVKIQLYTALPGILFLSYWWLMPESPRWLLTKGRVKEAEIIIRNAAKWNKVSLPDNLLSKSCVDDDDKDSASFLRLFSSKTLCLRTIVIFFNWTVVAFAYFGLSLNTENLAGDLYLNFGLSCLVEFPGYLLVILLMDRVGRRKLYCASMLIGGLSCVSTILALKYGPGDHCLNTENLAGDLYLNFGLSGLVEFPGYLLVILLMDRVGRRKLYCVSMLIGGLSCVSTILALKYGPGDREDGILTVVLSMIGKLLVTAGYCVQYIHSAELFPTVVRNAGLGGASLFARAGTMVAPYIVVLGKEIGGSGGEAFPLVVFGGMSLLSGLISLVLPETLNKHLPETIDDGERFGRSGAFYFVRSLKLHDTDTGTDQEKIGLLHESSSEYEKN